MHTVQIAKGEITVDNETVTILDSAKKQNRWLLISSITWTFFGIISVLRYLQGEDAFLLWTGMFIGIAHFGIVIYHIFFNSNESVIDRNRIVSVNQKNRFGNEFIAIKLKNGRVRKITELRGNSDEILKLFE